MQSTFLKTTVKRAVKMWATIMFAAVASFAQPHDVYLAAQKYTKNLPGGATAQMWIFASCDSSFATCAPASVQTTGSLVEVGAPGPQIDVPLGATSLVIHLQNRLTVPVSVVIPGLPGGMLGTPVYFDPATGNQVPVGTAGARVRSFTLEVAPAATGVYTWTSPKPGTYLYESGTLPSIQVPMGLYGALTIRTSATQAYPAAESAFNAERALLFSEIDPVQNGAVDAAANVTAYPSTIKYKPTYFLINGLAYDKALAGSSTFSAGSPAAGTSQWNVLLRLLNAGSESHAALSLGLPMSLIAEDGNVLPTLKRRQSDVLLAAGKTMDVIVSPPSHTVQVPDPTDPNLPPITATVFDATYPVFDRMLRLTSAGTQPDSGMLAYLQVGAGSPPPSAGAGPTAVNDAYSVAKGGTLSDNVLSNDVGLGGAAVVSNPKNGTLAFNPDGSFTYTPNAHFSGTDYFSYYGTPSGGGTPSNVAAVSLNVAFGNEAPIAQNDGVYDNRVGMSITVSKPGVLGNDTDNDGDTLTAGPAQNPSPGLTVALNSDGSFTASAVAPGDYTFQYPAKDAVLQSSLATVSLHFGTVSNLAMTVVDPTATPNLTITEYRWLVEEDRTWHHEGFDPLAPSQALAFHASNMPVVAQGCVGALCTEQVPISDVVLDPAKYYFVSVLPNDAGDGEGHSVGGAPIRPGQTSVKVLTNPQPLKTAQISALIFEDNSPTNGAPDGNEGGLNNFQITVLDAGGRYGMNGGQMSFDAFGNPLKNALRGTPGCPGTDPVGVILTCPDGTALIQNIAPGKYTLLADPPAGARRGNGNNSPLRQWVQTATIEGTRGIDAWVKSGEPPYFQEFGPPGYHVFIGFVDANAPVVPRPTGPNTVTGTVTNLHMSRPPDQSIYDSNSREALAFTTCWVGLNAGNGVGDDIAVAKCNDEGAFTLSNVPNGTYELVVWDQWLDQIIASRTVTVPGGGNVGNVPVFSWFSRIENNIFVDDGGGNPANAGNGIWDDGEQPFPNAPIAVRFRDGSMYQFSTMDNNGYYSFDEAFPFFNWMVVDADPMNHKSTGVDVTVDGGGPVVSDPLRPGVLNSTYPTGESTHRTELGPVRSEGWQGFVSQTAVLNWGRQPFQPGENGGITGMISYASTRSEDDVRMAVINEWEPAVPNVKVRLYKQVQTQTGGKGLVFVAETMSTSFDATKPTGCPGQKTDDAFYAESLQKFALPVDHCYDGMHNWNQVRPGVYDGRYSFTGIPAGTYVVEVVVPAGYELVKEEDKNVLIGDSYIAPVAVESMFGVVNVMPDQAIVQEAFAPSPGVANPACVGDIRRVPDNLSLFPTMAAPYAGADRATCDRKEVILTDQSQGLADFHLFTSVPVASHFNGMILDDLSQEFNAASPNFGEKWAPPFVPVSIRDFNGRELGRTYSDQWGIFSGLVPSTWNANVPLPSGYSPGMVTTCMNDPGPIHANLSDPNSPLITDPQYNPMYSNFCYTLQYMPGTTTYLDTPVLPVAGFASGYNPVDCAFPDGTPAIKQVNGDGDGPFITPGGSRTLTISAMGQTPVPNPAYERPSATTAPFNQKTIDRDMGFGAQCTAIGTGCVAVSSVKIGNVEASSVSWTPTDITATFPANVITGELTITRGDTGRTTVNAVTVTVENTIPKRVPSAYSSIQAAVDAATPGDLILVSPGTYEELVVMWKPVRLQGSGAGSTLINAAKYPAEKLDAWRTKVLDLFNAATIDLLPGQNGVDGAPIIGPGLLGTEEGAGITVLAKNDSGNGPLGPNSFRNHASRIDGFGVTGGDGGGGIFVNGWAHFLEISNNRVFGNSGLYHGGVRVGHPFLLDLAGNGPFGFNSNVNIHHNAITTNGSVEGSAGGGLSLCTGTDNYNVKWNFICGNFSGGDGGGIGHTGLSNAGVIANNQILFNQNYNQSLNVSGGGIFIGGDTPVGGGLTLGSGTVTIDANLIQGNHAGAGHGGGIRTQQVNGADVQRAPNNPNSWWQVNITNNMIVNNVAGYSGGGISLQDTARSSIVNNTVMNNDSTSTVGVTFTTGPNTSVKQPAGISSERHSTGPNGLAGAFVPSTPINAPYRVFSNPTLSNNIVYRNRAFNYDGSGGTALLVPVLSQSTIGACPAGAYYWDLGLVGDTSPTPGAQRLNPTSSILTSTSGYPGNSASDPQVVSGYCNGPRTLRLIDEITTLIPVPALDEGGNWIDVRWGPLTHMGDYHLGAGSPLNTGSATGAPNHDFDGQSRPQGGGFDIGADEIGSTTGGGNNPTKPTLTVLDAFTRANANTLGGNWSQVSLLGLAAVRVNNNQAFGIVAGAATWNVPGSGFGTTQSAAFTFANSTVNNAALVLKATGGTAALPSNFIRVQATGSQVVVATTTNSGGTYTTRGTLAGTFVSGDTLTARVDATGAVFVWKTSGGADTYLGSVTITPNTGWTGTGRIGLQLPTNGRVDDFAGGTTP
ncbi:MAG: Ig-like domain-containing protein [Terriglobales bacterium]